MELHENNIASNSDIGSSAVSDSALHSLLKAYAIDGRNIDLRRALNDKRLANTVLVSSFGAESVVLIHLVWSAKCNIPILFIDTGRHFPATLEYVEHLKERFSLNLHVVSARKEDINREDQNCTLYKTDPDHCCRLRKSLPLSDALQKYDAWISGRKRYHGASRSKLPLFERDGSKVKLNPLAYWDRNDIQDYLAKHDLPRHPLERFGFLSIGCEPCTRAVIDGESPRDGRWPNAPQKSECGIHISPEGKIVRR